MGGELIELSCSQPGVALAALRQQAGVIDAAIFGDRLHVLVPPGTSAGLQQVLRRLGMDAGVPKIIQPTLEDVFVRLVSRDRKAA
jgi:ABC-2 type transport system ATP-binding protein